MYKQDQRQSEAQNGQNNKPTLNYFQPTQSAGLYEFYLSMLKKVMLYFQTESK